MFDSDSGSFIVGPVELRVPRADGSVQVKKTKKPRINPRLLPVEREMGLEPTTLSLEG